MFMNRWRALSRRFRRVGRSGTPRTRDPLHWYVDSVGGSDSNDGLTTGTRFQTLAKLATVLRVEDSVTFAKDSHWREKLPLQHEITIDTDGSGAQPLIDASDIIPNLSFIKTPGRTNVHEVSVAPEWGGQDWLNVWQDDVNLTYASTLALCDSVPGSYYTSGNTGTITLYVHASDSSNVATNGKKYEYSARATALDGQLKNDLVISGVATRRNLDENGSLLVGRDCILTDCQASDGNKHCFYVGYGAALFNCTGINCYHGTSAATIFVCYEANGDGTGIATLTDCVATQNIQSAGTVTGYFGHTATSTWAAFNYDNCRANGTKLDVGYDATGVDECSYIDCQANVISGAGKDGFRLSNGGAHLFRRCTVVGSNRAISNTRDTSCSVTVDDCDFTHAVADAATIYLGTGAVALTLTGNNFNCTGTTGVRRAVYTNNAACSIYARNNTILSTNYQRIYFLLLAHALDSDFNTFYDSADGFSIAGTTYATVAAYKAATGQDANSVLSH
jgi:hypothetical protein